MIEKDMVDAIENISEEIQKLKKEFEEIKLMLLDVTNKLDEDREDEK